MSLLLERVLCLASRLDQQRLNAKATCSGPIRVPHDTCKPRFMRCPLKIQQRATVDFGLENQGGNRSSASIFGWAWCSVTTSSLPGLWSKRLVACQGRSCCSRRLQNGSKPAVMRDTKDWTAVALPMLRRGHGRDPKLSAAEVSRCGYFDSS